MKSKSRTAAAKPDSSSAGHVATHADVIKAQIEDIQHARKHRELQTAMLEIMAEQFNKPAVWVDSLFEVDDNTGHSAACLSLGEVDYCLPSCPIAVAFVAAGSPYKEPSGNGLVLSINTSFSSNTTPRKPAEKTMSETDASTEPNREYLCDPYGEIEAQLDATQENASRINGDLRPEISIKIRRNGGFWMGCQCGLKYIACSAASLKEVSKELNRLILENRK